MGRKLFASLVAIGGALGGALSKEEYGYIIFGGVAATLGAALAPPPPRDCNVAARFALAALGTVFGSALPVAHLSNKSLENLYGALLLYMPAPVLQGIGAGAMVNRCFRDY